MRSVRILNEFISLYITNTIKPLMRQSQYAEAFKIILENIYELLSKQDNLKESKVYQKYEKMREEAHADVLFVVPYFKWEITYFHAIIFIILVCVGIYIWYQHRDVQQYDRAREHLAAIHAAALQKKFQQTSCPICFEEFSKTSKKPTSNLHCGHCFCTECLDAWFSTLPRRDQVCPICRQHRDDLNNIRGENADEGKDNNERKDDDNKNDNDINNRHDNHFDKTTSQNNANYYGTDRNPRYRRNQQNMNLEDLLFRNELLFRLNRLRILYPRHIDNSMIHRWSDPQYRGSFYDDTSFQRRNPSFSSTSSRSSSSSSSSSSRSSFSFGGGSSFRGGGGGGRW